MVGDNQPKPLEEPISLNDAVGYFSQHAGRITALWTVFVAATFTAAGFNGLSDPEFGGAERVFLTIGYCAFSAGHWSLLNHCIKVSNTISGEIMRQLESSKTGAFQESVRSIVKHRSSFWYSLISHLVIDACVILIIWFRHFL
jgi:hypothetical protein